MPLVDPDPEDRSSQQKSKNSKKTAGSSEGSNGHFTEALYDEGLTQSLPDNFPHQYETQASKLLGTHKPQKWIFR